jgi:hypothetical protein
MHQYWQAAKSHEQPYTVQSLYQSGLEEGTFRIWRRPSPWADGTVNIATGYCDQIITSPKYRHPRHIDSLSRSCNKPLSKRCPKIFKLFFESSRTQKNHEKYQDSRSPIRDLNPEPPEVGLVTT